MLLWGRTTGFWLPLTFCFLLLQGQAQAQRSPAQGSVSASPASKDKAARDLFNAGRTAFAEGLFEEAMVSFQRAYELSRRPQLLFNVGMAAVSARRDSEAMAAFEQYLREIPDAENREYVEARIAILKKASEREGSTAVPVTQTELASEPGTLAAPRAATHSEPADKPRGASLASKWWFWSAIGAGVAAVAVTSVVLSTRDSSSSELQKGDVGGVIQTLRVAP